MPEITQDLLNQIKTDHDNIIERGNELHNALLAFNIARGKMKYDLRDFTDTQMDQVITEAYDNAFPGTLTEFQAMEHKLMSAFFMTADQSQELYEESLDS